MANPFEQWAGAAQPAPVNPFAKFATVEPPAGSNPFARFGFDQQSGTQKNLVTPWNIGLTSTRMGTEYIALSREEQKYQDLNRLDNAREFQRNAAAEAARTGQALPAGENPILSKYDAVQDPDIHRYAFTDSAEERGQIRGALEQRSREAAQSAALQMEKLAALPQDEGFNAALATGEAGTIASAIADDPMRLWRLALQSGPQMAGAVGTAPLLGPAASAAATSYGAEYGQALIQGAIDAGYNPFDATSIQAYFKDPAALAKAREKARTGGLTVAAFDALTAGIASKMLIPKKLVSGPLAREATNIAVQAPIQAAGGAGGEALKQQLTLGGVKDPGAVYAEALGEIPGTLFEVPALGLATGRYKNADLPGPDVGAPPPSRDITASIEEIEARTPSPTAVAVEAPAAPEAPTNVGVPGEQPRSAPPPSDGEAPQETGKLQLSDLPESTKIVAGQDGVSGSPEATKLARKAATGFRLSVKAEAEGQTESAAEMRKKAQENLDLAIAKGFALERKTTPAEQAPPPVTPAPTASAPAEGGASPVPPSEAPAAATTPPAAPAAEAWTPIGGGAARYVTPTRTLHIAERNGKFIAFVRDDGAEPYRIASGFQSLEHAKAWMDEQQKIGRFPEAPNEKGYEVYSKSEPEQRIKAGVTTFPTRAEADSYAAELNQAGGAQRYSVRPIKSIFGRTTTGIVPEGLTEMVASGLQAQRLVAHHVNLSNLPFSLMQSPLYRELRASGKKLLVNAPGSGQRKGTSSIPYSALARRIEKIMTPLLKRLMPDLELIIDLDPASPFKSAGNLGSHQGYGQNRAVIWLSPTALKSNITTVAVLFHEFGHTLVGHRFAHAPAHLQQAIYNKFYASIRKVQAGQKAGEFLTDMYAPANLTMLTGFARDPQAPASSELFENNQGFNEWFSFDEWMAEQVARWFTTEQRPMSLIDRFFKGTAEKLRGVLKEMWTLMRGEEPQLGDFRAPEAVREWMNYLLENRPPAPMNLISVRESMLQSMGANAKALGEEIAAPAQPELQYAHEVANSLRIPGFRRALAQADRWNWFMKVWNNILQLAWSNKHIGGLQRYVESVRQWHIDKMAIITRADGRIKEWRKLGKEIGANLSAFLFDLDAMSYLPAGSNARWPTVQELVALAQKHGLNQRALNVYAGIKGDFLSILDKIETAWIKDAQRTYTDPTILAREIYNIRTEIAALRSKPYFPHERFGDFYVTVKDARGRTVHFEQVQTAKDADKLRAQLARSPQYAGSSFEVGKLPEEVKIFRGLPPSLIKMLASKMPNLTAAQQIALEHIAFSMSPANSFSRHMAKRKGTPGYSLDAMRAYANYFLHAGGHIARLTHRGDMEDAVKSVYSSARAMGATFSAKAAAKRTGIADYMQRHLDYVMNPQSEWTALRSFAFVWHLAFNVSSAAINLLQVPMVAYPYLASRFNDFTAMNQLRKASTDLGKALRLSGNLPQDEVDAMKLGIEHGFLDESMAADLAGASQYGVLGRIVPGNQLERARQKIGYVGAWLFQAAEKVNRRVIFMAAYRMAKADPNNRHVQEVVAANQTLYQELLANGWSPSNAAAFLMGRDSIDKSMFNYSAYARPEFIRGRKGVFFAFWMFKQNMLHFFRNDPGAWRALLILGATSGLMGLPFAGDLADIVKYAARMFGKDFDPEREARQLIIDLTSEDDVGRRTAEILMHGLGKESFGLTWAGEGLGIPIPGFDLSNRLSMGNIIPGVGPLLQGAAGQLTPGESIGRTFMETVGAAYGVPLNILRAVETGDPDDFKTWERVLPAAAKNLARAYRFATEGAETNRMGAKVTDFDVTDTFQAAEVVGQALGFTPTRLSREWDKQAMMRDATQYWVIRRKLMFDQFDKAFRSKDREALADAREALRQFNSDTPDPRLRISASAIIESLKARAKNRKKIEADRALQRTYQGVTSDVNKIFPE